MSGARVLLTGISSAFAARLAEHLVDDPDVDALVGIDVADPAYVHPNLRFVRTDLRSPLVAKLLVAEQIDTVVHLDTMIGPAGVGRAKMKEHNVIGAMQLFAACHRVDSVRRVVVKSTTAVYGSSEKNPATFTEEAALRDPPTSGFAKDVTEVEGYARSVGRRRPDIDIVVLRLANLLGPRLDSTLSRLFKLPVVPRSAGYDPRLQFCHIDDALEVMRRAALDSPAGTFNVAGDGAMYLSHCVRLLHGLTAPVPQPAARTIAQVVRRSGQINFSDDQLRFLQYGRIADTARLVDTFGYSPQYTTRETFDDWRVWAAPGRLVDSAVFGRVLIAGLERLRAASASTKAGT